MADSKISALPAASAAASANEFAINESGVSKKVTGAQIKTLVTTAPYYAFMRQHADRAAFANDTAQHAIFDCVANGTLTLETGIYVYDALIMMSGMSATSGNIKWSLLGAGTATLAVIVQYLWGQDLAVNTNGTTSGIPLITEISSAANAFTGSTATVCTWHAEGTFEVTVAGTIIPSAAQSSASTTAVTTAGSYFRVTRLGALGTVSGGPAS